MMTGLDERVGVRYMVVSGHTQKCVIFSKASLSPASLPPDYLLNREMSTGDAMQIDRLTDSRLIAFKPKGSSMGSARTSGMSTSRMFISAATLPPVQTTAEKHNVEHVGSPSSACRVSIQTNDVTLTMHASLNELDIGRVAEGLAEFVARTAEVPNATKHMIEGDSDCLKMLSGQGKVIDTVLTICWAAARAMPGGA